jgi:YVTN family beta-propeller protein
MKGPTGIRIAGVVALVCAIAGAAVAPASTSRHDAHPRAGKIVARIDIPQTQGSGGLAVGEGAVWVMSDLVSTLFRIDPQRNAVIARIKVKPSKPCPEFPQACSEAAAGNGAVWVSHPSDDTVSRIDPQTSSVVATIPVGRHPDGIAVSPGAVWVANSGGPSVSRIDPASNRVVATIPVGPARACCSDFMELTVGGGSVWVAVPNLNSVVRVDPATNAVTARIHVPGQAYGFLAADQRAAWFAAAHGASVVWRIDPRTNRPTKRVKGVTAPIGLALGFGSLWVADLDAKTIDRVNPRTAAIVAGLRVGGYPVRLTIGFGSVWVRDDTGRVLRIQPQR